MVSYCCCNHLTSEKLAQISEGREGPEVQKSVSLTFTSSALANHVWERLVVAPPDQFQEIHALLGH
jgi:hypothetical protein